MTTSSNQPQQNHIKLLHFAPWIVAILATGLILYWGFNRLPQNAFDDAYITYRYADNLRQGLGLRYNPGEWVFGTTTPLFTLLLGGLGLAVSDLEVLGHWLGVIGWITAALLTIPLFQQENRPFAAIIAPLLIAVQPTFYTSLGMETPILVALMLALALFWLRGNNKIAVILAAFLILTRHDSALWLLLIGLEVGRRQRNMGKSWIEALPWREGVATLLLTLPWFIFAWLRYGSPFPNSAAAKIGQTDLMPVGGQSPFARALLESLFDSLPPPAMVILFALLLFAIYLIARRLKRFWWLLAWPALYSIFYSAINVANFPWYFLPLITVIYLALALTIGSLLGDDSWTILPSTSILQSSKIRIVLLLLSLLVILFTLASITLNRQDNIGYRPSYLSAAHWLRQNTPPDATIATIEIGVIGYHSRRPILDTQGLISPDMTGHQLGWDDTLVYALNAHQPDYALALPGTAWDSVTAQWWFQQSYQPVEQFAEVTLYGRLDTFKDPTTIDLSSTYQGGLILNQLTLATTRLKSGRPLTASLSISVTQSSLPPVRFTIYLVDNATFERYAATDVNPFNNLYPSQHWQKGDHLDVPLRMTVPTDLPWGAYNYGIIIQDTAAGVPLLQSNQSSEIHLGLLTNGRPDVASNLDLNTQTINQSWANGIILHQMALPNMPVPPGADLQMQLQWDTTSQPGRDWTYFIHLVNDQDKIVAQLDQHPWSGRWPTPAWVPNQPFWENAALALPPDLPSGSYHLRLGFYIGDERLPLVGNTADFLWLPEQITVEQ